MIVYQDHVDQAVRECRLLTRDGEVASYIPELAKADASALGIAIATAEGGLYSAGDAAQRFTIQSISKVLIFTCCLLDNLIGDVLRKVSLEPAAEPFNAISSLETKNFNRPLNPMINAGAIAGLTLVRGDTPQQKFERVLGFARLVSGNETLGISEAVYQSEKHSGSRNRALAYYMKSTGVIDGEIEPLLDAYFRICAIEMHCGELAKAALVYAMNGHSQGRGASLFSKEIARTVTAVVALCGMYDESGTVAVSVGVPSKSGVGGGILSVVPGKMGIGVFGPALNARGSSAAGLAALRMLSQRLDLSIY